MLYFDKMVTLRSRQKWLSVCIWLGFLCVRIIDCPLLSLVTITVPLIGHYSFQPSRVTRRDVASEQRWPFQINNNVPIGYVYPSDAIWQRTTYYLMAPCHYINNCHNICFWRWATWINYLQIAHSLIKPNIFSVLLAIRLRLCGYRYLMVVTNSPWVFPFCDTLHKRGVIYGITFFRKVCEYITQMFSRFILDAIPTLSNYT